MKLQEELTDADMEALDQAAEKLSERFYGRVVDDLLDFTAIVHTFHFKKGKIPDPKNDADYEVLLQMIRDHRPMDPNELDRAMEDVRRMLDRKKDAN